MLACYCIDVIRYATQFNQQSRDLFILLKQTLTMIDQRDAKIADIQSYFELQFLKNEGLIDPTYNEKLSFFDFKKRYEAYSHIPLNKPRYISQ